MLRVRWKEHLIKFGNQKSQREGHISGRNDRCEGPEVAKCSELHCNTVATGHSICGYLIKIKLN